eukprot:jgi/Chrzof1/12874/Cz07g10150.t1
MELGTCRLRKYFLVRLTIDILTDFGAAKTSATACQPYQSPHPPRLPSAMPSALRRYTLCGTRLYVMYSSSLYTKGIQFFSLTL